ncbi:PorV/PorQ family protein [candidate division KSB1 bacterium]|nr:PorV/PorQ family protein [candidate division KSB1 bacterium]
MKKSIIHIFIMLIIVALCASHGVQAQTKIAQTGFQFLTVNSDAKASATGEAMTSLDNRSTSLFFNPAGMANMSTRLDMSFSINSWLVDIKYSTFALAVRPANGKYGVVGLTFQSVDYGDIQGTMTAVNEKGYIDTEMFSPSALAMGLGYAKALTDRFSVGGQIKGVYQNLGKSVVPVSDSLEVKKNYASAVAFDFGTLLKTGYKSLAFGMSVRNFSREVEYETESFEIPLLFTLGISMDVMDYFDKTQLDQSLVVSIDATHPRSHPEQLKIGLDYTVMNMLSLRCGYVSNNDEDGISYGVGLSTMGVCVDYSYTPFGIFDKVQRVTARLSL